MHRRLEFARERPPEQSGRKGLNCFQSFSCSHTSRLHGRHPFLQDGHNAFLFLQRRKRQFDTGERVSRNTLLANDAGKVLGGLQKEFWMTNAK